jgi:hypothetical protein
MKSLLVKSTLLLTVLTVLSGCNIDGVLSVSQSVNLIDKKGKVIPLQAGRTYKAEVGCDDGKLEFNIKVNGKEKKIKLRLPYGQKMPKYNGQLAIPSSQSGQPVDIIGELRTDKDASDDIQGIETCTKQDYERVCEKLIAKDAQGNTKETVTCGMKPITLYGKQKIVYHYLTTTTRAGVLLLDPASKVEVANFKGKESSTQTIVTFRGNCHVHGGGGHYGGGGYSGGHHSGSHYGNHDSNNYDDEYDSDYDITELGE